MTWWNHLTSASHKTGRPLTFDISSTKQLLEDSGFDALVPKAHKMPIGFQWYPCERCCESDTRLYGKCESCIVWPESTAAQVLGKQYGAWIANPDNLDALSLGAFCRYKAKLLEDWEQFRGSLIQEMRRPDVHVYNNL